MKFYRLCIHQDGQSQIKFLHWSCSFPNKVIYASIRAKSAWWHNRNAGQEKQVRTTWERVDTWQLQSWVDRGEIE